MNKKLKEKNNYVIKSKLNSYFLGFFISLILTSIPFFITIKRVQLFKQVISIRILVVLFCILQVIVQMYYFLHLKDSMNNIWNIIFVLFTFIIIFIIIIGSTWIMYNLHYNVMMT